MAIIPFLEKVVGGDGNIARDMRALGGQGKAAYGSGINIADEGIAGWRRDGSGYESVLRSARGGQSVLGENVNSVLKRARGGITDRNTRDIMATGARLKQARLASGGRLSAEAAQEYMTEAEAEANRAAGESNLAVDSQQAELELKETNTLRDRLAQARDAILGAGERRMQLGQAGQIASLGLRHARQQAIAQAITSFAGMFGGA